MDYDEKKKRQLIRVAIAEIGMAISVVAIVIVATLATMGFFITGDGQIEQSGLMQIHSIPTGATVNLDGSNLFSRTNLSRTMPAGDHRIIISRDGYDTWENVVKMYSGVLVRLYYPRLFLLNRVANEVMPLKSGNELVTDLEFYSASPSRNYIIYAQNGSAEWRLIDVRSDDVKETTLDLSSVLPWVTKADTMEQTKNSLHSVIAGSVAEYTFDGDIEVVAWSDNDEKVLVKASFEGQTEWVLVNLRDVSSSLNLSKTFGLDFVQISAIDGAANQLFALENRNLRRIDIASKTVSGVLLNNVAEFSNYESNLIYVTAEAQDNQTEKRKRFVGVYRNGENGGTVIAEAEAEDKIIVTLAKYFDDYYMCYLVNNKLMVLYGSLPTYSSQGADLSNLKELELTKEFSEIPEKLSLSGNNEYLVAQSGEKFMSVDLDDGSVFEYDAAKEIRWLDDSMLYDVNDGHLIVWDFDGANRRNLNESVKKSDGSKVDTMDYDVVITSNNRWLYYLGEGEDGFVLMRERIVE